ncbi:SMI1/KNR4 family protein [Neobacillus sp. WH10]|uniref:SMI1/KNR4 family protein n=1 Tax=Neobacillus sp. WH10 TaxID=3047873 RepID=UPI0024C1EEAC|nr:SMI1/KNR4 family protein [Neobacillus sp. WH10]WHY79910.1 SMI1/KNR4 family protein [Neobacillus sp. WH10]
MYSNKILGTKANIVETDLLELEKEHKFKFPSTMREHYLLYNGGYPEKSLYVGDESEEYVVDYFIPVKNEKGRNLSGILRLLNDEKVIPNWLIPFADEAGGNLFCFSISEKDNGAIYYYNHEFEYGDNPENLIVCLSESLPDFINSLVECDDE